MKVCILGLGYIGLPNALLLARSGHNVLGVDIKRDMVDELNSGQLPFEEPGLQELFNEAKDNFKASTEIEESDCFIIAVPTPLDKEMKMADLKAVKSASEMISSKLKDGDLVILESTVPPGTSSNFVMPILRRSGVKKILYAHCPERAIPGQTLNEMQFNNRIIGGYDDESTETALNLYRSFVKGDLHTSDVTSAEYVKLMENTYRDINIALANEFALISEEIGIDVWKAIQLANLHPRVDILKPGPGVGGHCIAIDPWFMVEKSSKSRIVTLSREINDFMPIHVVRLAKDLISQHMTQEHLSKKITLFGLAYKGNVDDTRESPALKIKRIAESEGMEVSFFDPVVGEEHSDMEKAIQDTDCIVLVTDHDEFMNIDPKKLLVRHKNLIDSRNILDHEKWIDAGFNVKVLGKGAN